MSSFDRFCKQSQAMWKKGRENAAAYGQDIPAGTYTGKLTKLALAESQGGNFMVQRNITITEGDFRGSVARDNMMLNNDIGMGIFIQFIERHDVDVPEALSEKAVTKVLDDILAQDPAYRFRLTFKNDYPRIAILDIGSDDSEGDDASGEGSVTEAEGTEEGGNDDSGDDDKEVFTKVVDFCKRQGIEFSKKDDLDSLKEKISEYKFPAEGVTKEQLVEDEGFDADDVGDDLELLDSDDVELLDSLELGETIIRAKKKDEKKKKPLGGKKK